jgi:hypothetical protein
MTRNKWIKTIVIISTISLLLFGMLIVPAQALLSQNSTSWYWVSDTNATAVAIGDVNNDGLNETVTCGYYNNGASWVAQLVVWNSITLVAQADKEWLWGTDTQVSGVAIGDVNNDGLKEIVTVGEFFNGVSWIGQLIVWNGVTLVAQADKEWLWGTDTQVSGVAIGDVNTDGLKEIVTAGSFSNGVSWIGQLIVWNGVTLVAQADKEWLWGTNTHVSSVAIGDVNNDHLNEIATGGDFNNGVSEIGQLIVWNGVTLVAQADKEWLWGTDTLVSGVAIGDVNNDGFNETVTCGDYNNGVFEIGQLIVWNGVTLVAQADKEWLYGTNTRVVSVAVGKFSSSTNLDIVTGGLYNDGVRNYAQLIDWNGNTLTAISQSIWFTISDTMINSVAVGDTGLGNRIVEAGQYWDTVRSQAQITVWS